MKPPLANDTKLARAESLSKLDILSIVYELFFVSSIALATSAYALPKSNNSPSVPLSLVMYMRSNLSFAIDTGLKHWVVEQCSTSGLQRMSE